MPTKRGGHSEISLTARSAAASSRLQVIVTPRPFDGLESILLFLSGRSSRGQAVRAAMPVEKTCRGRPLGETA